MKKDLEKFPLVKDSKTVVPKDLKVKIGTDAEVFWTDLRKKCEDGSVQARREIVINDHIIGLCKQKVMAEKERFK